MKKSLLRLVASVAMVATLALSAFGQLVPKVQYLTVSESGTFMLSVLKIQQELTMSSDQLSSLARAVAGYASAQNSVYEKWKDDATDDQIDAFNKELEKADQDFARAVLAFLRPDQSKRLREIALQQYGFEALGKDDVAKELALSDGQKKRITEIVADLDRRNEEYEATLGARIERIPAPTLGVKASEEAYDRAVAGVIAELRPMSEALARARTKAEADAKGTLNPAQLRQWEQMQGAPFQIRGDGT
jgi:hypothetical protein